MDNIAAPEVLNKMMLANMFGSDDALQVSYQTDDGESLSQAQWREMVERIGVDHAPGTYSVFPDGSSAIVCTNYAQQVLNAFPGRVAIVGFFCEDNPDAQFSREGLADGHDFAIVDSRFLVDPWIPLVVGDDHPVAYDLQDPADAEKVKALYGPVEHWKSIEDEDEGVELPEKSSNKMRM